MTANQFLDNFWSYYLTLEKRFLQLRTYIEFDTDNFPCFSCELLALLQTICSEIDVVCKEICGYPNDSHKNMSHYKIDVANKVPDIRGIQIRADYFQITLKPFEDFLPDKSMAWWGAYTGVKHARIQNIKLGNLENTLLALSALYTLEKLLHKEITGEDGINQESDLFHIVGWSELGHILWPFQVK